jgi:hypothetical protein
MIEHGNQDLQETVNAEDLNSVQRKIWHILKSATKYI